MVHSLRRCIITAVALITFCAAYALDIRGIVADIDGEPMIAATVRLLKADSTFVKGTKTDVNGGFVFTGLKRGKYIVEGSYLGYRNTYRDVNLTSSNIKLDPITLEESSIALKEVTVTGVRTEIKVKEDTVEYNAGSYKTGPNAVAEDLLKRLPGVEVDSEGGITANGKTVTKILLDGKEFFADDPKVASKNLPVEMIETVQVVDRKSDLARLTGVDDGEEETVINLTVKKNMKNGWFGTIEAGYGTDDHYLGQFNVNRFWNDNQFTLLGNFNNVNQLGFTDSNGNRFRRFGGTQGVTTSQALGLNFNVGNKEIFRVGGNLMYSHSDRDVRRHQERRYEIDDSVSFANTSRYSRDKGDNFRADFRIEWKPDSFNTLEIRPQFSYNINDSWIADSTLNSSGMRGERLVSRGFNESGSRGHSIEFGTRIIYNHNFRKRRGRSFSVSVNYNHSNVNETENSYSRNIFYLFNDSIDLYDQVNRTHTWSDNVSGRVSFTEPLGNVANGRFLTISYNASYRWNNADKMVYDHPVTYPQPGITGDPVIDFANEVFNSDLGNRFRNDNFTQNARIGIRQVTKAMNLEVGMSFVPTMSKSIDLINEERNIPERWVMNYAPFVNYRHRFNKTRSLYLRYNGRSSQPSLTQLQPVPDMSDPLNIVVGNPDLKPSFSHNMNFRFQDFNTEHQRSIMLMAMFNLTQNSIISNLVRNTQTAGQTTYYANVNGVWNAMVMNMISMPLRNKFWQISNHISANYNRNVGFNNGNRNVNGTLRASESFGIAFRPDNLEFELRPRYSIQYSRNSFSKSNDNTTHTFGGSFSAYYNTPIGIILQSDINYSANRGYGEGFDLNQWIWNASISYPMLRDKSLTLSVKGYDMLNQRSTVSHSNGANYIEDASFNGLSRYFMATVSWKFNTFGKNRPTGRGFDGPGGPGGYRGPGGPGGFGPGPRR